MTFQILSQVMLITDGTKFCVSDETYCGKYKLLDFFTIAEFQKWHKYDLCDRRQRLFHSIHTVQKVQSVRYGQEVDVLNEIFEPRKCLKKGSTPAYLINVSYFSFKNL